MLFFLTTEYFKNVIFVEILKYFKTTTSLFPFNLEIRMPMKFIWNDQENLESLQNRN